MENLIELIDKLRSERNFRTMGEITNADEYNVLMKKYPKLFEFVMNSDDTVYNRELVVFMLEQRGKLSEEHSTLDRLNTDMSVSERLADMFLYENGNVERPSQHVIEESKNRLRKKYRDVV